MPRRTIGVKTPKPKKEPAVITECPEAATIGAALIQKHHSFLREVPIVFLTTTAQRKRGGKLVHATLARMTAQERYFFTADDEASGQGAVERFVVLIDAAHWGRLSQHDREALIDERLCGLSESDKGKVMLTGYDAMLYTGNVHRFGAWNADLRRAVEVLGQGRLDMEKVLPADALENASDQEQAAHAGPADMPPLFADEPVAAGKRTREAVEA